MEARSVDDFFERCNQLMLGQTPENILRRAHTVLSDPVQWTRGARARDARGVPVAPNDPAAVCWCVEGAISMACNPFGIMPPYFMVVLDRIAQRHGQISVVLLNEYCRHEVILEVLQEAISECAGPPGGSHDGDERPDCGGTC